MEAEEINNIKMKSTLHITQHEIPTKYLTKGDQSIWSGFSIGYKMVRFE